MELSQERFNVLCRGAKIEMFKKIIETAETFVLINLEHEGVRVPEALRKLDQSHLVLKFSNRYDYRLDVLEEGIEQRLRFNGEEFPVFIAWDAMFGIHDGGPNQAAWPFHAPTKLRGEEPATVSFNGEGPETLVLPDGTLQDPQTIH